MEKHLQIVLPEDRYRLLQLVAIGESQTLKVVLEQAVETYCLQKLGKASIEEARELLIITKGTGHG